MEEQPQKNYKELARQHRITVLKMTEKAQSSHIGSNLSSIDILTVLYDIADFTPTTDGMTKDVVVVKSWNAANVYACLVRKGLLPQEAIDDYGKEGTPWTTILEPVTHNGLKIIPAATGAMGYHLPFAVGLALAKKIKKEEGTVYCLISDGELNVGSTWESLAIAKQHKLDNLVLIIDKNGLQAMSSTKEVLDMEPVDKKIASFGWIVNTIDGHDYKEIEYSLGPVKEHDNHGPFCKKEEYFLGGNKSEFRCGCLNVKRPRAIIANTVKGKGWKRAEGDNLWHYSHVNDEMLKEALGELQ